MFAVFSCAFPGVVKAERTLLIDTPVPVILGSGSEEHFSLNISECSQPDEEYIQVDLYDNGYSEGMAASERPDPMLMIARTNRPSASYDADSQKWTWWPDWTEKDMDGYDLKRPYHRIVIDNRACTDRCSPGDHVCENKCNDSKERGEIVHVVVKNVEYFRENTLNGKLRARCSSTPPCPEPDGKECNDKGSCKNVDDIGVCKCDDGFGDVACDASVTELLNGEKWPNDDPESLNVNMWKYYSFTIPPGVESTVIVELYRTNGDPILFVKRAEDGIANGRSGIANGVPSMQDFDNLADKNSHESKLDNHHVKLTNAASGLYYVGVFNTKTYIEEKSKYYLRARWNNDNVAMCPFDCFGDSRGTCNADIPNGNSVCTCHGNSFGGEFCQGKVISFNRDYHGVNGISGVIAPGEWNYIEIDKSFFPDVTKDGLQVRFSHQGNGHPLLLFKDNDYPTYENMDFYGYHSWMRMQSLMELKINADSISEHGVYYIGILNINYYVHNEFSYNIIISAGISINKRMPNFISVSLVMIFSLFVCMLIALAKRIVQNRQLARMRALRAAQIAANPELAFMLGGAGNRRVEPFRGTPRNVISRIPIVTFRGAGDGPKLDDCDYSCAVCLDEFENGDRLRQLTLCGHQFHTACLDEWLGQHDNCPLCRAPIEVESQGGAEEGSIQQQQNIELPSIFLPMNNEDINNNDIRNNDSSTHSVV